MDIDHFSYLIDRQHRLLLIGLVALVMAAIFTLFGEALKRYDGIVYRADDPKSFWLNDVGWVLAGLFFVAAYLYQNSN